MHFKGGKSIMRGLDIRVMLARTRIIALLDPDQADGMYCDVMDEAMVQGMRDARDGVDQVPILFRDEKLLVSHWHSGFDSELEWMEMEECPHCHDDTGNPCPVHG